MLRASILLLCLGLAACHREQEWFPPPEQRQPAALREEPDSLIVDMGDPHVTDYIVSDISSALEGATWRWTQKRPTVKVLIGDPNGLKFVAEFTIAEVTMKQTGPVTLSFFIGDRLLARVKYDTPGARRFEKPVDPAWLQADTGTLLSAAIDKLYVAPVDGAKLGFILTRIGLESLQKPAERSR